MSFEYLLIPRLRVQTANAQSTWWLINHAPVMAANLFAHNLGRKTGVMPKGVAIVHHDAQLLAESSIDFKVLPQQRRAATYINKDDYSSKNQQALSLQPTATQHLCWSLVLAYDDVEGLPSLTSVQDAVGGARFAGGLIVSHDTVRALQKIEDVQRAVRAGFWLIERQDLLGQKDDDVLDSLIAAVTVPPPHNEEDDAAPAATSEAAAMNTGRWVVPTTLGYASVSEFKLREGAREGVMHAYGEPLVGLVQYLPVRRYDTPQLPIWRSKWLRDDVFVVTQRED